MAKAKAGRAATRVTRRQASRRVAGKRSVPGEAAAWARQEPLALAAIDFWNRVLRLAAGASLDRPLDGAALQRLVAIVRAVSWVESRHGMATTNQGPRDPMQCGHPRYAGGAS
jgi:hypothetical protein